MTINAINMNPVMFKSSQAARASAAPQRTSKSEVINNEKELLMNLYKEYMKQAGGYQVINGQMVHVTTALHTDQDTQKFVTQIEERLRALGAL